MTRFSILFVCSALCLLGSQVSTAQVNIEKIRENGPERGFSVACESGLAARTGNVDVTTLTLEVRIDSARDRNAGFLITRGDFG
jgi:hypothetical protein